MKKDLTQFTPGPWRYHYEPGYCGEIIAANGTFIGSFVDEPSEVDARLLVAAPSLLADLQEAATTLRRYEKSHRAKGTDDSTAKAEVNAELAARFEATIAQAVQPTVEPCGGCGETDPDKRCIGCGHPFAQVVQHG